MILGKWDKLVFNIGAQATALKDDLMDEMAAALIRIKP